MTVWTFLVVTVIGGSMHGESHRILYPSHAACIAAHHTVSDSLGYDHQIRCEPTGRLSASVRPMPRPVNRWRDTP